jgi:hypothetical protein
MLDPIEYPSKAQFTSPTSCFPDFAKTLQTISQTPNPPFCTYTSNIPLPHTLPFRYPPRTMDLSWTHQRQPQRQAGDSARSGQYNASNADSTPPQSFASAGNYGTINPDYRQAQSYNPSSSGTARTTRPPAQVHDTYRRVDGSVTTSTRDV